jgi:hypothetical protein
LLPSSTLLKGEVVHASPSSAQHANKIITTFIRDWGPGQGGFLFMQVLLLLHNHQEQHFKTEE